MAQGPRCGVRLLPSMYRATDGRNDLNPLGAFMPTEEWIFDGILLLATPKRANAVSGFSR